MFGCRWKRSGRLRLKSFCSISMRADQARILRDFDALVEGVYDPVDVHLSQAVLGPILHEAATGVDHKDALAGLGVHLVDDDDAGGDAGAIEQVGWQTDDALDVALPHQRAADVALGVAAEQHAVRQDAGALARCSSWSGGCAEGRRNLPAWRGGAPKGLKRSKGSLSGSRPLLQRLSEKGGLATT